MSESERDTLSVWDVLKPTADKLSGVDRLLMGAGILLKSRFRDNITIATLIEGHAGRSRLQRVGRAEHRRLSPTAGGRRPGEA